MAPALGAVAAAGAALALGACRPPGAGAPKARPAPLVEAYTLSDLIGGWRWLYRTEEAGTSRVEEEAWRFAPDPHDPAQLIGRYVRTVEVRALDRVPFKCNQLRWYRQRATFDVVAGYDPAGRGLWIRETGYDTEPSPCDHGIRHLGRYQLEPGGGRVVLHWENGDDAGTETLWQVDDAPRPLPRAPWPATYDPAGAWRWDATWYDEQGNIREEHEWWQITRRDAAHLDATYRRRVMVRSPDGSTIACANAPQWSFDDAYVLEAQQEDDDWHFHERGVAPGDHPCLRATPRRDLDEATAEQIGDYFVLEWRGKRRQILYRP